MTGAYITHTEQTRMKMRSLLLPSFKLWLHGAMLSHYSMPWFRHGLLACSWCLHQSAAAIPAVKQPIPVVASPTVSGILFSIGQYRPLESVCQVNGMILSSYSPSGHPLIQLLCPVENKTRADRKIMAAKSPSAVFLTNCHHYFPLTSRGGDGILLSGKLRLTLVGGFSTRLHSVK